MFNQAFILNAFHLLLNKLLPLTSTDLESLEDEPEEWLIAEKDDEEAWAFEFRVHLLLASRDVSYMRFSLTPSSLVPREF